MANTQENKLIRDFCRLKTQYLDLESTNNMMLQNIMQLNERIKYKEQQKTKLIQMCSEKISRKNDALESLRNEIQHLQEIIKQQNELITEQNKTIEELKNSTNIQTTIIKHPCFESDKRKAKKEQRRKPIQVRYPNLNITLNGRRKVTNNESLQLVTKTKQRRKLYNSDDETVDLSSK